MSSTATRTPVAAEIDQWLARFDEALTARRRRRRRRAVRAEDSYWRDLVAFTWNIKTVEGRDGRQGHARAHARADAAARLARDRASRPRPTA